MKIKLYSISKITGLPVIGLVVLLIALFQAEAQAQPASVKGQVTEESTGSPVPGASVMIKGTDTGTVTDADGRYILQNVSGDATLVFSFIGYEIQEVTISGRSTVDVQLKESLATLDEIVVIGYGSTTKKEITGSVASLKSKDFNTGSFNDPMGLIQGKVAGLSISKPDGADPMAGYSIILRGTNTLTSGQGPLIVIDGVVGADLKNINFQDVESFDVLKDGAAAAIYGTRGTNGVIIITTKGARSGQNKLEYSAQVSTQVAPRSVENLTADEFKYAIENYAPGKSGSLYGSKTDWFDEITRDLPISFQHNIALSGGSEKFSHRTSFTQSSDQGLLRDNESKRYLLKTNIHQKAFDNRLELDLNVTNNIREYKPSNYDLFYQAFIQNPTQPVYESGPATYGGYSFRQGLEYYNPVAMLKERTRDGKTTDIVINMRATLKVTDKLRWVNFVSSQKSSWEANSYKSRYYPGSLGKDGEAEISTGGSDQMQYETTVNYETVLGNDHNFQAVGGYSYQEFKSHNSYMGNSDFDTDIYTYNNIGAGAYLQEGQAYMGSYKDMSKLISLFGRVMYNYKEKYLASVSLRREGSSKFGNNNKWGWFPAVSVGWRLNEESFIQDVTWVDDLKLRVGYGVTGNQDFGNYKSLLLLERAGRFFYNGDWINTYQPASNPNPDLRWEQKQELNAGVDFALFNKRLSGTLDYYYRRSKDLLYTYEVSVPPYIYNELFTNVGSISNRGIELTLNATLLHRGAFQWSSSLTASHNKNVLDKLSNSEFNNEYIQIGRTTGAINVYTQRIEEGKSLGTFYGPVWLGVDEYGNDRFKNANPVGEVDEKNWEAIGSAYPDVMLGWSNTVTYKNWSLGFVFRSNIGGKVLNQYRLYYENWPSIGLKNVVKSQLDNPNFTSDTKYSSKYIEDATFLKLDNVTLRYTFIMQSKYVSGLSTFCSAQNVFWLTGYKGLDPEVNLGGLSPGIESLSYYPRSTSITLGVNATF